MWTNAMSHGEPTWLMNKDKPETLMDLLAKFTPVTILLKFVAWLVTIPGFTIHNSLMARL